MRLSGTRTMLRLGGLWCGILLLAGCTQLQPFMSTSDANLPLADFAFVSNDQLQLVSADGIVTPTQFVAASVLPAVSSTGEAVLYAEAVADKFQLSLLHTPTNSVEVLLGLTALPSQLAFSDDADLALMIMNQELYLVFIPQRRLVRVHEGVVQAGFSLSNQRVDYLTTEQSLLSREFALDGNLADVKALAADPFIDQTIPERTNTAMAGWSKQGLGVYYVDTAGEVTLVEYE